MATEKRSERLEQQRLLYGEPIGDLVRRLCAAFGLNQGELARVLGLSPAMLSQLAGGQRVKIGNPHVVSRLQTLLDLAADAPRMTRQQLADRLSEVRESRSALTATQQIAVPPDRLAVLVGRLLRAVASGRELDEAATRIGDVAPGLAELIRVYGGGTQAEAERHLESVKHLL
ncbi:MAG: DNA-binding protein [Nocardioidaceae bacterium]